MRREAGTFCPGAVTTLGQGLRPAEEGDSVSGWNLGGAPDKQDESAGKRYVCAAPVPISLHQPSKNEKKKSYLLESVIQSKVSQKNKYCVLTHICGT